MPVRLLTIRYISWAILWWKLSFVVFFFKFVLYPRWPFQVCAGLFFTFDWTLIQFRSTSTQVRSKLMWYLYHSSYLDIKISWYLIFSSSLPCSTPVFHHPDLIPCVWQRQHGLQQAEDHDPDPASRQEALKDRDAATGLQLHHTPGHPAGHRWVPHAWAARLPWARFINLNSGHPVAI